MDFTLYKINYYYYNTWLPIKNNYLMPPGKDDPPRGRMRRAPEVWVWPTGTGRTRETGRATGRARSWQIKWTRTKDWARVRDSERVEHTGGQGEEDGDGYGKEDSQRHRDRTGGVPYTSLATGSGSPLGNVVC